MGYHNKYLAYYALLRVSTAPVSTLSELLIYHSCNPVTTTVSARASRLCIEAEGVIGAVVEVAGRCGLIIMNGRSNVLLYNHRGLPPERVAGIAVANSV